MGGQVRKFQEGTLGAPQGKPDDGHGVGVGLGDRGRIGVHGKALLDAGDAVAHVVGGALEVDPQVELHRDVGALVETAGRQRPDSVDAVDGLFQDLRDLVGDHLRARALVERGHVDDGGIHGGVFPHAHLEEPDDAQQQDEHRHDHGEHRTADARGGEAHGEGRIEAIRKGLPGTSREAPTTRTVSPSSTPDRISTRSASRIPTTGRTDLASPPLPR